MAPMPTGGGGIAISNGFGHNIIKTFSMNDLLLQLTPPPPNLEPSAGPEFTQAGSGQGTLVRFANAA